MKRIKIHICVNLVCERLKNKRRAWAVGLERASWDLWAVSSSNQNFSSSIHLRSSITNWALPAVGRPADHRLPWLQHHLKLPTDDSTQSRNGLSFLAARVSTMTSSSWKLDTNSIFADPSGQLRLWQHDKQSRRQHGREQRLIWRMWAV